MVKDLVCGMDVDKKTAKFKSEYMGKTYYFCCDHARQLSKNPAKHAGDIWSTRDHAAKVLRSHEDFQHRSVFYECSK